MLGCEPTITRGRAQEVLPLIQAFADGKVVQLYIKEWDKWTDDNSPDFFHRDSKHRIKPA